MRLIQQKPSWSLHAFLRFNDLKYVSEYTPSFSSLGRNLPLLVTGKAVVSEEESMNYLSEQLIKDGTDHRLSLDGILSKFIKSSIVGCFNQIVRYDGDHRDAVFRSSPIGINVVFSSVLDIQDALNKDKFDFLPGASMEELIAHLNSQYKQLDMAICDHECERLSSVISISKHSFIEANKSHTLDHKRGQADAILFGHLAEALSNETVAPIVKKYSSLVKFFENICSTYFATPFANDDKESNWSVALESLLSNPYLAIENSAFVKSSLTTPKKGAQELKFKSSECVHDCKSILYLNEFNTIDEREIIIHDHHAQGTSLSINYELFPSVQTIVDKSKQLANNIKSSVGLQTTPSSASEVNHHNGIRTDTTSISVSIGGVIYLGLIAACFVSYAVEFKK